MKPPMTPQEYAAAVRDALGDLPARDRDELLEDLDEHLAEVAAESGESLEERLGSPESYAAELRAAYGGRTPGGDVPPGRRLRERATAAVRGVHTRLLALPLYRQAAAFVPELRPAWWVLRGYAVALAMLAPVGADGLVPGDIPSWVFTLAVIWGSVWLGRRSRTRSAGWGRALLLGANTVVGLLVIVALADAPNASRDDVALDYGPRPQVHALGVHVENVSSLGGPVFNIFPYAEDGTPLHNVRLYDQDGNPIMVEPGFDHELVIPCNGEPPIRNAYPLPLRSVDPATRGLGETCAPVPPTPTAAAGPYTEPPAQPSASPSAEPSAEPSPEPAAGPSGEPAPAPSVDRSGEPSASPTR